MKQGQKVKLYKLRKQSIKNPYKFLGEFLYQNKNSNFITLKADKGYIETISIIDLRLKHYKLIVDGRECKVTPIQDAMELERINREADLAEYRKGAGAASYKSMIHSTEKRKEERRKRNAS